jgi:hypothetical protein
MALFVHTIMETWVGGMPAGCLRRPSGSRRRTALRSLPDADELGVSLVKHGVFSAIGTGRGNLNNCLK